MDSELTLVNPAPPTPYFLSSTDLKDTVIYSKPSVPLYKITSTTRHISICDGTAPGRTIAVVHRRDLLSDTISFPHRHYKGGRCVDNVSIQRWLRRSKVLDGTCMFTFDTEFGPYVWRVVSNSQAKVFADYDLENPVATCNYSRSATTNEPAFILHAAGEPLRDDIAVVYLVQRYRVILESKALDLFVGRN